MIDNRIYLETAEGIDLELIPAGIGVRTLAFFYDFLIRIGIYFVAALGLGIAGDFGTGLMFILVFLLEWGYPIFFELLRGATPGKKSFGLMVVYDNGLPITVAGSLTRNLFRVVDFMPSFYLFGAISILLSKRAKRLGDLLAGTMVVYQHSATRISHFSAKQAQKVDMVLTLEQQRSIIDFAERSKHLSPQRQQELANILTPLTGCDGQQGVDKLKAIAASLVGKT